jgi:hypothetical protein
MIPAPPTDMLFFVLKQALSLLMDLVWVSRRYDRDKALEILEILLLRQQLRILQRKHPQPPHISRWEKLTLLVLLGKLTTLILGRSRLSQVVLLVNPETLLKWQRELVRRKWLFKKKAWLGRPRIPPDVEALLMRLAKKNPACGYGKLEAVGGGPACLTARSSTVGEKERGLGRTQQVLDEEAYARTLLTRHHKVDKEGNAADGDAILNQIGAGDRDSFDRLVDRASADGLEFDLASLAHDPRDRAGDG